MVYSIDFDTIPFFF